MILQILRLIPGILFVILLGMLLGDEIVQRHERMELRAFCYQIQAMQVPEMTDYYDFRIKQLCRVNIP